MSHGPRPGGPEHAPLFLAGLYDVWHQKAAKGEGARFVSDGSLCPRVLS